MKVEEKYPRPCFATFSESNQCGIIIFEDGSHSEMIMSVEEGELMLKELVKSKKISKDDADRIGDHLQCSELIRTKEEFSMICAVAVFVYQIEKREVEHQRLWLN